MEEVALVKEVDEKHIWYKGKQYIRLDRFLELKTNQLNEMEILSDEVDKLNEENKTLRVLLARR